MLNGVAAEVLADVAVAADLAAAVRVTAAPARAIVPRRVQALRIHGNHQLLRARAEVLADRA